MRKKLLLCIVVLYIISVIIGVIIFAVGNRKCITSACKNISNDIMQRILSEADPCVDFYTFACGDSDSMISQMSEKTIAFTMGLLERPPNSNEPKSFEKGREFFRQCLTVESDIVINKKIKEMIKKIGGFPTVDGNEWKESEWTYEQAIKLYTNAGLYSEMIFSVEPDRDPMNSLNFIMVSRNPTFLYPADCEDKCKNYFTQTYVESCVKLGADKETAIKDAKELIEFEINLINATKNIVPVVEDVLEDYARSLEDFASAFSFLDWNKYFEGKLRRKVSDPKNKNFIVVTNDQYLLYLNSVFKEFSKRLLANYMLWYNLDFFNYLPGRKPDKMECFYKTTGFLSVMTSAMAIDKKHDSGYGVMKDMISNIRAELKRSLQKCDWMDEKTKKKAEIKLENMGVYVGYYDFFADYKLVDKYYEDLFLGTNYLESLFNILKHFMSKRIDKCYFGSLNDVQCKMYVFSTQVMMLKENGPFYLPNFNSINVPDQILQPPLFHPAWPKYINYGRLGLAVGHEMTHGFDIKGSANDKDGQSKGWWTEKTFEIYNMKIRCVAEQYSNISFFNGEEVERVNGYITEKENFADVAGMDLALEAYKRVANKLLMSELLLPGLNYTHLQLFFISAAQYWCDKYDVKPDYGWAFYNNKFPPYPVRVTGIMQNSYSFSEAFKCEPSDEMNPTVKCEAW